VFALIEPEEGVPTVLNLSEIAERRRGRRESRRNS